MPERELIAGEEIKLGGETFVLPPYNLKFIVNERPGLMAKMEKAKGEAKLMVSVEMIHKALVRNYPDITVDRLMDLMDSPSIVQVMQAISRVNEFKQPGEMTPGE
jgi:hypothetical protein